jgi:hypothetical protein
MRRAAFVAGSVASLGSLSSRTQPAAALVPAPANGYPAFTWERVPYAAQIGKFRGDFTPAETGFIARNFAFIALGPDTGRGTTPNFVQEDGFYRNASAIKAANPACKVLFFWGVPGNMRNYAAYADFDPAWRVRNAAGTGLVNDVSNPAFRRWWARSCAHIVGHAGIDGVFVDALNPEGGEPLNVEMLQLLRDALNALPKPALLLLNGVPAPGKGGLPSMLDLCDGFMIEYFAFAAKNGPDKLKAYLLDVIRAGAAGKIVMAHAYSGFAAFEPEVRDWDYARKVATAKRNVAFPLAAYLACAQRYSYFQYGWGWENIGGAYALEADGATPDPAWYPEFLAPLGEPLEAPVIDGYVFTRRFRHADVRVDLSAREGRVAFR